MESAVFKRVWTWASLVMQGLAFHIIASTPETMGAEKEAPSTLAGAVVTSGPRVKASPGA